MAQRDPAAIAADWAQKLGASGDKIRRGVQSVSVAPGQSAARQKSVWAQNTAAAVDKWAANTANVSLNDWQTAMTDKGIQRIATGAQASQSKMQTFMTRLLPYIDSQRSALPPRGNLEANINRSVQWQRAMAKFQNR